MVQAHRKMNIKQKQMKKTSDDKKQIVKNKFENLIPARKIDHEEMNHTVEKIFKK